MFMRIFCFIALSVSLIGCQNDERASAPSQGVVKTNDTLKVARKIDCPVSLISGLSLEDEFGPGTSKMTRCLHKPEKIKVVYQLNKTCKNAACSKAYGLGNINNAVNDYETTHGLKAGIDYEIIAIIHSKGYKLALNDNSKDDPNKQNPFQAKVQALVNKGVKFYFCQNTARKKKVKTNDIIPGINYVTSGVTALGEFQQMGYAMIQP